MNSETERSLGIVKVLAIALLAGAVTTAFADARSAATAPFDDHDMSSIAAGSFEMGTDRGADDEAPVHRVSLAAFRVDRHEVTNREFAAFVAATGYETSAETLGYCWGFLDGMQDFAQLHGASWRAPQGPGSTSDTRRDHPVVCVSWQDATAFAHWSGKRLPSEAEWEYAARGGLETHLRARTQAAASIRSTSHDAGPAPHSKGAAHGDSSAHHAQGDDHSTEDDIVVANVWQGSWPEENARADGYFYTAPVASFEPNPFGIHDMIGNVWEWTADWYGGDYYTDSPRRDPHGPAAGDKRVARGGSWFCSEAYCGAYSTHFRGASPPDQAFNNVGFRCAADAPSGAVGR